MGSSTEKVLYLEALEREIESALPMLEEYSFPAAYFGGGSPSVMNPDALAKLLRGLKRRLDFEQGAEITIEVMPQTVGTPSLSGLKAGGFSRVSLSMQSAVSAELEMLECGFTVYDVQNAMLFLDKFRFNNVNLDIMYGIPGQTAASFSKTLAAVCGFAPNHISLYPFPAPKKAFDNELSIKKEQRTTLVEQAVEVLGRCGYQRYSLYHFARDGRRSKYFQLRYEGMDYIGFGLGARSLIDGISYANTTDFDTYIANSADCERIATDVVKLSPEQHQEYCMHSRAMLL
jgi:coproporphyrinogen III oxidase-like Fe-S oxidoreductase